jgi:hypothetical protein
VGEDNSHATSGADHRGEDLGVEKQAVPAADLRRDWGELRRNAWSMFWFGGILALVSLGALIGPRALWGAPRGMQREALNWNPADWYGVYATLLAVLVDFGLVLFIWALTDYFVMGMLRRVRWVSFLTLIILLHGLIRKLGLLGLLLGVIFLCRIVYVSLAALAIGWPVGHV